MHAISDAATADATRAAVTLDLPAGRSLIHRPPAQHLTIPYANIDAIDARFEAYGTLGMEMMRRAYVLHRKGGELDFGRACLSPSCYGSSDISF
jgi:hypothetical protein